MTIGEAIEILSIRTIAGATPDSPDYLTAIKLGIEALERFQNLRAAGRYVGMPLLKGETPGKPL